MKYPLPGHGMGCFVSINCACKSSSMNCELKSSIFFYNLFTQYSYLNTAGKYNFYLDPGYFWILIKICRVFKTKRTNIKFGRYFICHETHLLPLQGGLLCNIWIVPANLDLWIVLSNPQHFCILFIYPHLQEYLDNVYKYKFQEIFQMSRNSPL